MSKDDAPHFDIDREIRLAQLELETFIESRSTAALRRIKEPTSFGIKSASEEYNKGWITGFRRCLAYFQQQKEV